MKESPIIPTFTFTCTGLPFKIQTIQSFAEEQDEKAESIHTHDYYEMIWVTNGKCTIGVDLQEYNLASHLIVCIKPGQTHWFQIGPDIEGYVLSFTESFFNISEHEFDLSCQANLLRIFSRYPIVKVHETMQSEMREVILKMKNEYENLYPYRSQLLKRYFRILLIYITRQVAEDFLPEAQSREVELVKSFMSLLDDGFKERKKIIEYALQLFVSPNYLTRVVKRNTGYPAGHHIRQRVILEAKRLGRYSDASMKAIAYDLGFLDIAHFSKFFKSVSGTNFSDFKKKGLSVHLGESTSLDRA